MLWSRHALRRGPRRAPVGVQIAKEASGMEVEKRTGFVALLDVLGFSQLIARESHQADLEGYFRALDVATDKGDESVDYLLFSDTIVIYTANDTTAGLDYLLRACSQGLNALLKAGLPVRGAIAHGSYMRSVSAKGV